MGLLRVLLALAVVITHNGNTFLGSNPILAVPAFFIISGFVIALVLNEKYLGNVSGFYFARFLRLWPSYAVVLAVVLLFFSSIRAIPDSPVANLHLYATSLSLLFFDTLGWFGFNQDLNIIVMMDGTKNGAPHSIVWRTPMAHMWSVGVELTFYMIAPLLARRWKAIAIVLIIAFVVHVVIILNIPSHHPVRTKSTFNSFYLFLAGMLSYWAWRHFQGLLGHFYIPPTLLAIGVGTITLWAGQPLALMHPLLPDFLLLLFALLIIPLFHYSRQQWFDRQVGELSYGVYLTHWPILNYLLSGHFGDWRWTTAIAGGSIISAVGLQLVVVRPLESIRRSYGRTPLVSINPALGPVAEKA